MHPPDLSDEELLEAYCNGDSKAFEVFFRRHLQRVCGYALKKGVARDEASEVSQEVFLKLHAHIAHYEIGKKALPWFFTIVHNTCIDWLRRQHRSQHKRVGYDEIDVESLTASECEPVTESKNEVDSLIALNTLSEGQRKIVEMRIVDDLSFKDISVKTGRTEISLRKSYSRSVQMLRDLLHKSPGGD